MVFVAQHGKCEHDNGRKDVGRRNETLGRGDIEAHTGVEDDGQEIGDGVGVGGCQTKEGGKAPDLQVQCILQVTTQAEWFGNGVVAIFLNSSDDECGFLLVKEFQTKAFGGQFWKVDDEKKGNDGHDAGSSTLKDEDPSATFVSN